MILLLYLLLIFSAGYVHLNLLKLRYEREVLAKDLAHIVAKKKQEVGFLLENSKMINGRGSKDLGLLNNDKLRIRNSKSRQELENLRYFKSLLAVPKSSRHAEHYAWASEVGLIPSEAVSLRTLGVVGRYYLYQNMHIFIGERLDLSLKSKFNKFKELKAISPRKTYSPADNLSDAIRFVKNTAYKGFRVSVDNEKSYLAIDSLPLLLPSKTNVVHARITNPVTEEVQKIAYDLSKMD